MRRVRGPNSAPLRWSDVDEDLARRIPINKAAVALEHLIATQAEVNRKMAARLAELERRARSESAE